MTTFIIYVDDPVMALDLSEIVTMHVQQAQVVLPQSTNELAETIRKPDPTFCLITKGEVLDEIGATMLDLHKQRPFPHISIGKRSPLIGGIEVEIAPPSNVIVNALKKLGLPPKSDSTD